MENNTIKYDVFIKGKAIDLVCLTKEIAYNSNWYNWFNDEETTKGMQKHYYPNTRELQQDFYENELEGSTNKLQVGIYHKKDCVLIGVISLNNIDFINRSCEIAGLIGEKKNRNFKDYIEANKLLINHAFNTLNLNRVYGGSVIKEVNEMFCRVLGFESEGIQKKAVYINGSYIDVHLIGLLKQDYIKKTS
jgi:[ribosomal protein S5]-alanine N-acetyltransferase